jgi:MFS family permease
VGRRYKWVALSNTTLGLLMAAINASSVIIALPAIFRGIGLNPLDPDNFTFLLWLLMGYPLVLAVLVPTLGRIGDIFGRVKMYNLGFVIFSAGSILLSLTWSTGAAGATELVLFRLVQAFGGALVTANAIAILTDAFPVEERGMAYGINGMAFGVGSFVGILAGGVLAVIDWRWVFLVNVPVGIAGTVWSYLMLKEIGVHKVEPIDWIGNLAFGAGLTMILVGFTYGIQPSGASSMSWGTPFVEGMFVGGAALLVLFVAWERQASAPMFRLSLFRIRAFTAGNVAQLLQSIAAGGLLIILSLWLQGIWLPLRGYDYEITPLWAGIFILPLTAVSLVVGPLSGRLSDRFGPRPFATAGLILAAISFALFMVLPVSFSYVPFALILGLNGAASGLFISPNIAAVMNSVPARDRGAASGMRAAFVNMGMPLSLGIYFSLMALALNATVPQTVFNSLTNNGVAATVATKVSDIPPIGYLFAALLGYNPMGALLGSQVLSSLGSGVSNELTSRTYFPLLISGPFHDGLVLIMGFSVVICLVAAVISWLRGTRYVYPED